MIRALQLDTYVTKQYIRANLFQSAGPGNEFVSVQSCFLSLTHLKSICRIPSAGYLALDK